MRVVIIVALMATLLLVRGQTPAEGIDVETGVTAGRATPDTSSD